MELKALQNKEILEILNDHALIIDEEGLLAAGFVPFWKQLQPLLRQKHKKAYIPYECYQVVANKIGKLGPQRNIAQAVMKLVEEARAAGLCTIIKPEGHILQKDVIIKAFAQYCRKTNLFLITQNKALAKQVLEFNKLCASFGKSIRAALIYQNAQSWLQEYLSELVGTPSAEVFTLCNRVTTEAEYPLYGENFKVPGTGNVVYTSPRKGKANKLRLRQQIGFGGEGKVYVVDEQQVAKIFEAKQCTNHKLEKLKKLIAKGLSCPGVCFPTKILYNSQGKFVGYLMPKAKGVKLQSNYTIREELFKHLPGGKGGKKEDMVQLAITILEKLKYLHARNLLVGDINLNNFMVVSPKEVYLVDTDSYQVEDLPCVVGTPEFDAPELQEANYRAVMRTKGSENFALATLLFTLLLPGQFPYRRIGGAGIGSGIKGMDFPYALKKGVKGRVPKGDWLTIWDHLEPEVRSALYNTFKKGGKYATPQTRLGVQEWLKLLRNYLQLLKSGKLVKQDPMANKIFPSTKKTQTWEETENYDYWESVPNFMF